MPGHTSSALARSKRREAGQRSLPQIDATQRLAPSIDMTMDGDDLLEQAKQRLAAPGELLGKQEQAEAVPSKFDASIEAARTAVR
jgi:iron complex transport system substrate-binding protein